MNMIHPDGSFRVFIGVNNFRKKVLSRNVILVTKTTLFHIEDCEYVFFQFPVQPTSPLNPQDVHMYYTLIIQLLPGRYSKHNLQDHPI